MTNEKNQNKNGGSEPENNNDPTTPEKEKPGDQGIPENSSDPTETDSERPEKATES